MKSFPAAALGLACLFLLAGCGNFGASKELYVQRGNGLFDKGELADTTLNYRKALKKTK